MIRLDKSDYARALLTDTSPSDVPIIFSNDGLYINFRASESKAPGVFDFCNSVFEKIIGADAIATTPFEYKIYKNEIKFRSLGLIHPSSQFRYIKIYRDYSPAIIYLCSKSKFSIRRPRRVSNSLFIKGSDSKFKYKEFNIDTIQEEIHRKHANSYFSYSGFDRAYKLYQSPLFLKLEKTYPILWKLDVSNCFDSIYTHSIAWAIKNREYIKANLQSPRAHQFCNDIDQAMQNSNNAETNGIPIGSEFSRIFSEIIFQSIDFETDYEIEKRYGFVCRADYTILRYVDDYFLFSKSDDLAKKISLVLAEKLSAYNLYLNEGKLEKYERPFITKKTSILGAVELAVNKLMDRLYSLDDEQAINLKKINDRSKFTSGFIREIKSTISVWGGNYSDISSFLISVISKRLERLTNSKIHIHDEHETPLQTRDCICILVDIIFFFYTISPSVMASNRVARSVIIADKFIVKKHPGQSSYYRSEIMRHIQDVMLSFDKTVPENYIFLEQLNIFLAVAEFGCEHSIPPQHFEYIKTSKVNYFEIISLLYYFRGRAKYGELIAHIEILIMDKLSKIDSLRKSSEKLHLFLDVLSCPHVSQVTRSYLLDKYLAFYEPTVVLDAAAKVAILDKMLFNYWFVKWNELNLLHLLERKELRSTY
ncbi:antiviral reverse transcriptase Drt3b [Cellvibrio sp. QJXJ]|uniref:antiviral reverse transcriptase Drt3b n=1 Tax=Cellvibrio sp. QJXJ TaxID=2964606 RepID=UPI0021C392BD|nr:antiviral reverse transcriptase Drt3b [Cellvibrio sp. QJXJ]UUA72887.1 RNA-directed DNA polymerase [Cellvibrio sp. QJXJ]